MRCRSDQAISDVPPLEELFTDAKNRNFDFEKRYGLICQIIDTPILNDYQKERLKEAIDSLTSDAPESEMSKAQYLHKILNDRDKIVAKLAASHQVTH